MDFTPEQRKYIDWKLKMSDERQLRNGNKTYTLEEIQKKFAKPKTGAEIYKTQNYR